MLYTYSVTPLAENEIDARCAAIIEDVQSGAYTMPLFVMALTPEGNPVWDKAKKCATLYGKYRYILQKHNIPSGILIQASLGHGYTLTPSPFQPQVQLTDGQSIHACCPLDPAFLQHFADVITRLAKEHPQAIMLDDDFRLLIRPGKGCACPLHMQEFNRRAGTNFTREDLYAHLLSHPKTDRYARIFADTQRQALVSAAQVFRDAIDRVDPTIQGINCTSGTLCEAVQYTNKVFAGGGNRTMVRIPNGCYAPYSVREFSNGIRMAAICSAKLKQHGVDIILAETDTIPFNRYGKSARYLHAHYTASILQGIQGAKHWLTRTSAFEPASGKAYRAILSQHMGFYEALARLTSGIRWQGAAALFTEQTDFDFATDNVWASHPHCWVTKVLERMGIPFYFTEQPQTATFLEGNIVDDLTDDTITSLFTRSVFLDGFAARALCERGFGHLLGVDVTDWDLARISSESFDKMGHTCCTRQKNAQKLTVTNPKTETLSRNIRRANGTVETLSPAVTMLPCDNDTLTAVFCGSPDTSFDYTEGFSFLNETRKAQLVALLSRAGTLPVYLQGDDEVCMQAGYITDGRLLCAFFPLGTDPIETPHLYLQQPPKDIRILQPDGSEQAVPFTNIGEDVWEIEHRMETMYPTILLIR